MHKKILLFNIFVLLYNIAIAQETYEAGTLPKLNASASISELWEVNFKAESQLIFSRGEFGGGSGVRQFNHNRTELALGLERKTSYNTAITGGYLLRMDERKPSHRLFQQFSLVRQYGSFNLSHRFASDQTFSIGRGNEYRIRYRVSTSLPLNGEKIDLKETYLKFSHEYLGSLLKRNTALEIRNLAALGYVTGTKNKIEGGFSYRAEKVFQSITNSEFWIYLAFYFDLDK